MHLIWCWASGVPTSSVARFISASMPFIDAYLEGGSSVVVNDSPGRMFTTLGCPELQLAVVVKTLGEHAQSPLPSRCISYPSWVAPCIYSALTQVALVSSAHPTSMSASAAPPAFTLPTFNCVSPPQVVYTAYARTARFACLKRSGGNQHAIAGGVRRKTSPLPFCCCFLGPVDTKARSCLASTSSPLFVLRQ